MRFLLSGRKTPLTDEEIIARFKAHADQKWIDILFDRYSHLAYAVAFNYLKNDDESKDVVLEIFQKLEYDLITYEIRQFHSWLHRVVRNKCLRQISKKISKEELTPDLIAEDNTESDQLEKYIVQLAEAIKQLNDEQRICIQLFYLEKKSYKEISDQLQYDISKVKSYIQNGKRNLKIILEKISNE